jgi:hypothetical protein
VPHVAIMPGPSSPLVSERGSGVCRTRAQCMPETSGAGAYRSWAQELAYGVGSRRSSSRRTARRRRSSRPSCDIGQMGSPRLLSPAIAQRHRTRNALAEPFVSDLRVEGRGDRMIAKLGLTIGPDVAYTSGSGAYSDEYLTRSPTYSANSEPILARAAPGRLHQPGYVRAVRGGGACRGAGCLRPPHLSSGRCFDAITAPNLAQGRVRLSGTPRSRN